jgi:lysophospholipase L1-like esterase/pimeloyl-ACP methyl ester carboxylesterase
MFKINCFYKSTIIALFLILIVSNGFAQKRYKDYIFNNVDSITNIKYGSSINLKNEREDLYLDIISPSKDDTLKKRPLLIFIHGGGFKNNSKTGSFSSLLCTSFAKRGYVTATIDYRLGIEKGGSIKDYHEAMYRAQQDGKAAIRFFRRYAEKYGIDTSQIFITGSSAGSKTALAIAYMDENEVPADINQSKLGTLEGESGNEGYSSKVKGVLNNWGAMVNYKWIKKGDVPLFNVAGTIDKTVPYDSSFDYHSFKYGPYILYQHCLSLGIPTGWRPFNGAGHTLDNKKTLQDSAINSMAAWLYTQLAVVKSKNEEGVLRYEADINKFDSLNLVEKHSDSALLFLGSSYIRFWTNIRKDLDYPDIIHRGFGGSNLRDVAYYVERIVYPHHPKAIYMYVGNDIVDSEKDKSPDQVFELFKYTVEVIRKKFPTTPITWLHISPSKRRWGVWDKVQIANKLIDDYCKNSNNLHTINFSNSFIGEDGLPIKKLYRDDKLHYNEVGNAVWGNAIKEEVKRIANTNSKSF